MKTDAPKQAVDRRRRFHFVAGVVGFTLVASTLFTAAAGLGLIALGTGMVRLLVEGMLGLATAVSMTYITGSVVDYNGGFGNLFTRNPQPPRSDR